MLVWAKKLCSQYGHYLLYCLRRANLRKTHIHMYTCVMWYIFNLQWKIYLHNSIFIQAKSVREFVSFLWKNVLIRAGGLGRTDMKIRLLQSHAAAQLVHVMGTTGSACQMWQDVLLKPYPRCYCTIEPALLTPTRMKTTASHHTLIFERWPVLCTKWPRYINA